MRRASCLLICLMACISQLRADDWPQWMGPTRDGQWKETGIVRKFPDAGPPVKWRAPVSLGYAGPAVAKNKVYLFDFKLDEGTVQNNPGARIQLKGSERLLCLNAETSEQLWKYEYPASYEISYPSGPRCTPTVDGERVYILGAEGQLTCVATADGSKIWSRDLKADYKTKSPIWGFCGAPLVDGEMLYCIVGGEGSVVVAFNKATGEEQWKALSASESGYCPPSLIEHQGKKELIIWDADKINSLEPATGKVLWSHPLKPAYGMSIMMPRKAGDYLFASGIGHVGELLKLKSDHTGVETMWSGKTKTALYAANATPIIAGQTLYGADCDTGALIAVDLKDGSRLWTSFEPTTGKRRAGHGTAFLVQNTDCFFLFGESGDLIIANLSPEKYEELDRANILEPTGEAFGRAVVWSHPAFANRCCFARNDKELVCVDLKQGE